MHGGWDTDDQKHQKSSKPYFDARTGTARVKGAAPWKAYWGRSSGGQNPKVILQPGIVTQTIRDHHLLS